jgi:hypothetical protein
VNQKQMLANPRLGRSGYQWLYFKITNMVAGLFYI